MSLFSIKRIKRAAAEFVGGWTKQPDWSQLPYEILLKVFRYLSNSDKFHAALTCKSWLRPLSVPSVWESGDFNIDAESADKAIRFMQKVGRSLRHIRADCRAGEYDVWGVGGSSSCTELLYQFLVDLLNSGNKQLLTFKLTNIYNLEISSGRDKSRSFSEVAQLLTKVLEDQQQLRVLDLSNSQKSVHNCIEDNLTMKQGIKMLNAVSRSCANTLQKLAFARLVSLKNSFITDLRLLSQFRSAISSFSKLSELDLSYDYLENDLLLSLANTNTSLKVITVRADEIPMIESQITPLAWENLTAACPELRVLFFIKPISESYFQDVTMILTPSMPLYQVKWKSSSVIAVENIDKFFQHLGQNFQKTLHHLECRTGVPIDTERFEVLFKSIQPCTNLDSLTLGLTSCVIDDVEMYKLAIRDVVKRCPLSCDLTLNVQVK